MMIAYDQARRKGPYGGGFGRPNPYGFGGGLFGLPYFPGPRPQAAHFPSPETVGQPAPVPNPDPNQPNPAQVGPTLERPPGGFNPADDTGFFGRPNPYGFGGGFGPFGGGFGPRFNNFGGGFGGGFGRFPFFGGGNPGMFGSFFGGGGFNPFSFFNQQQPTATAVTPQSASFEASVLPQFPFPGMFSRSAVMPASAIPQGFM